MAKRLTDNTKWDKIWFRKLTPVEKCFWGYITDRCNHAGIWEVDFETAQYFIGSKLDETEIKKVFEKQIMIIGNGKRWFIKDFIEFQYSCSMFDLNPKNKLHLSVINILVINNLIDKEGTKKGLIVPLQGDKNKDINKDKNEDIGGNGKGGGVSLEDCEQYFEDAGYERKLGRVFWGYYSAQSWTTGGEHPRKIDNWQSKAFEIINSPKKLKWLMGLEDGTTKRSNKEITPERIASDLSKAF